MNTLFSKHLIMRFLFVFAIFSSCIASAQNNNNEKESFWDNVRFGGGVGLSIGNNIISAGISPSAIYDINKQFSVGTGLNWAYTKFSNQYSSHVVGANVIGLFNPTNELQVSAEFEQLNVSRNFKNSAIKNDNYWYPALFLGAGYRMGNISAGIRYDILYNKNKSIYSNAAVPYVRVFF